MANIFVDPCFWWTSDVEGFQLGALYLVRATPSSTSLISELENAGPHATSLSEVSVS